MNPLVKRRIDGRDVGSGAVGSGAPAHEAAAFTRWLLLPDDAVGDGGETQSFLERESPAGSSGGSASNQASVASEAERHSDGVGTPRIGAVAPERLRARDLRYARWQRVLVQDADAGFRNVSRAMRQEGALLAERDVEEHGADQAVASGIGLSGLDDPDDGSDLDAVSSVDHGTLPVAVGRAAQRLSAIAGASAPLAPEGRAVREATPIVMRELVAGYHTVLPPGTQLNDGSHPLAARVAELAALQRINAVINSSLDVSHVLTQTVAVVRDVMHVDTAAVYLLEDTGRLVLRATRGLNPEMIGHHSLALGEGITGWTARHGQPVTVADAWQDERFRYVPSLREEPFHGWLSVPIILFRTGDHGAGDVANKLVGVLSLMTQQVKAFSPEDVTFVETVAGQVAIAVENARLYGLTDERLREKVQQLEALQRVSASLVSSLDLSEVLAQMARQAALITNTDMSGIFQLDDATNRLSLVASYNLSETYADIAVPVGEGAIGLAVAERIPIVIFDAQEDPRLQAPSVARWVIEEGYRSMFSVPLISRDRVLGGVSVYTRQRREFSLDQIHMLCTFANDAAIAIDNARLYEQTRQALAMKSVLLQELHHRVKNNLQMMGSLLRLQMRRTRNAEARKTLAVTHSQIESLGAAHDLLSQDTGASGTSMGRATVAEIARRVADIAVADLLPRDKRITIDTADAQVDVGSQRATLIALVLNELLCNAILHGLEDRDTGHVRVSAKRVVDRPNDESVAMDPDGSDSGTAAAIEHVQIEVVDDGAGLPPGFVLERDAGLGLTIVQRLVIEQLRGALTFESIPVGESGATGTCARLWLPVA